MSTDALKLSKPLETLDLLPEITLAKQRLEGLLKPTPLIHSSYLSQEYGCELYFKPENLQLTGSFKIRGAFNKICSLASKEKIKGVVAASAGNHSQGVALASKMLGVQATIVMPTTTPLIKVDATRSHGAEVVLFGDCYDEAAAHAKMLNEATGRTFIHPFDDIQVMAGQGTIGLEILQELEDVDLVLVPVGGGGLAAGVAAAIKQTNPRVRVVGVEPIGAMAMKESLACNRLVCLTSVGTIADGVAVKRPGELTFQASLDYLDEIITVTDQEIMEAFCLLLEKHKLVGENAGVLTIAALKHLQLRDQKVVSIISGGNIDVVTISSMINRGLVGRGRLFCFSVELPDKPGQLAKISQILADCQANVVKLDHNQFKSYDRLMNAVLEVTCETNGHIHVAEIQKAMASHGYLIHQVF